MTVLTKKCFKCGVTKDIELFYKHKEMADGYLGKCIICTKKDVLAYREQNIDSVRAYDRQRGMLPKRKAIRARVGRAYRKKYPGRYAANTLLNNAIKHKRIIRPKQCQNCSKKGRVVGHHEDYCKPLEVDWWCQACHTKYHARKKR